MSIRVNALGPSSLVLVVGCGLALLLSGCHLASPQPGEAVYADITNRCETDVLVAIDNRPGAYDADTQAWG